VERSTAGNCPWDAAITVAQRRGDLQFDHAPFADGKLRSTAGQSDTGWRN
jgi:hypothetical protein